MMWQEYFSRNELLMLNRMIVDWVAYLEKSTKGAVVI
jgi:hypothetical protein